MSKSDPVPLNNLQPEESIMNLHKMARIGLAMIGVSFLFIALACIGYVLVNGLDIGKLYKEHRAKQRAEEFLKASPGLTFLERCQQQKLECSQTVEYGEGYVAQSASVFFPFWEKQGARFRWQNSQWFFDSEEAGYRSSESFRTAGPRFTWESGVRDISQPPTEPPPVPLEEIPAPPAK